MISQPGTTRAETPALHLSIFSGPIPKNSKVAFLDLPELVRLVKETNDERLGWYVYGACWGLKDIIDITLKNANNSNVRISRNIRTTDHPYRHVRNTFLSWGGKYDDIASRLTPDRKSALDDQGFIDNALSSKSFYKFKLSEIVSIFNELHACALAVRGHLEYSMTIPAPAIKENFDMNTKNLARLFYQRLSERLDVSQPTEWDGLKRSRFFD